MRGNSHRADESAHGEIDLRREGQGGWRRRHGVGLTSHHGRGRRHGWADGRPGGQAAVMAKIDEQQREGVGGRRRHVRVAGRR